MATHCTLIVTLPIIESELPVVNKNYHDSVIVDTQYP